MSQADDQAIIDQVRADFEHFYRAPGFNAGRWRVSHLNFLDEVRAPMKLPETVTLMEMTLGRGIQLPGVGFTPEDEVMVARALDGAGIPQINPWVFGQASEADFRRLTELGLDAQLGCVLQEGGSLSEERQIDILCEVGVDFAEMSTRPFPGLPPFRSLYGGDAERKARVPLNAMIRRMVEVVEYSRRRGLKIRVQCSDAAWADLEFLVAFSQAAYEAGADWIGVGDHNGIGPTAFKHVVATIKAAIPKSRLAVHTHNLVGLGGAAALAAVEAGAEVVDVSVNSMGGTGGQADLAQVAVALEAFYGVRTGIKLEQLTPLYRLMEFASGYPLHALSPLVGEHAYTELGIVQEKMDRYLMAPILPETVGNHGYFVPNLMMQDWAVRDKLVELGVEADDETVQRVAQELRNLARTRKLDPTDEVIAYAVSRVQRSG